MSAPYDVIRSKNTLGILLTIRDAPSVTISDLCTNERGVINGHRFEQVNQLKRLGLIETVYDRGMRYNTKPLRLSDKGVGVLEHMLAVCDIIGYDPEREVSE